MLFWQDLGRCLFPRPKETSCSSAWSCRRLSHCRSQFLSSGGHCPCQFQGSFSFFPAFCVSFFSFFGRMSFSYFPMNAFQLFAFYDWWQRRVCADKKQFYQSTLRFLLSAFITDLSSVRHSRFKQVTKLKIDWTNALLVLSFRNYLLQMKSTLHLIHSEKGRMTPGSCGHIQFSLGKCNTARSWALGL